MNQDDKLRRLREWVDGEKRIKSASKVELAVDCDTVLRWIDRLLAEDEPEKPSETPGDESWRLALSGWLKRHDEGCRSSLQTIDEVVAFLVRRALETP